MGGNHHSLHHRHSHGGSGHRHSGGDHDHNGSVHAKKNHIKPGGNTGGSSHGYGHHHGGAQKKGHVLPIVRPAGPYPNLAPQTKSTGNAPHNTQVTKPIQKPVIPTNKSTSSGNGRTRISSWQATDIFHHPHPVNVSKNTTYNYTQHQRIFYRPQAPSGQHLFPAMGHELQVQGQNVTNGWQRAWNTITSWFGG